MVELWNSEALNRHIAHMDGVGHEVHHEAEETGRRASGYLEEVRGSTRWHKIIGPGHLTFIEITRGEVDSFVDLIAPNPMAIEFGHEPSGVFGPGGRFSHVHTRAPHGLYILTHATGFTDLSTQ